MTIKELRKEKGMTQAQFAQSLGVSTVTISAIEGGRLAVSAKLAGKVKEVYGVEPEPAEKKAAVKAAAKKTAAKATAKKAAAEKAPEKQLVKKVASVPLEIYIQSPTAEILRRRKWPRRCRRGRRPALCGWTRT